MTPIICTDVWRDEGSPLYTVKVYDIDAPVNYKSYDCFFYEQGRDLNELLAQAREKINKELHIVDGFCDLKYE